MNGVFCIFSNFLTYTKLTTNITNMRLRFVFIGLLSLLAVSCTIEEVFAPEDNNDNFAVEFYASIDEQPDADTKVYADDQLRVLWNADDRITIFSKNTYNQQYRFLGEDGDNAGGFKKVPSEDEYITSNPLSRVYAVYPYQETIKISNDGIINTTISSVQTYKKDSFGIGANTMVSSTEDNMLKFKNVGGYLSLKFYGEGVSVSSITLKSNSGELIAGDCTIDMSSGVPVSSLVTERGTDVVTMTCDPPVVLPASASEAIQFIFVLYPGTLTGGFTVTINTPDGGVFEKSSVNERIIKRSSLTRLGAIEVVPEYPQPNNIIYYTSTDGNVVQPDIASGQSSSDLFGSNIVSNEYVDGQGIITFDGDVTCIKGGTVPSWSKGFSSCQTLSSINIPASVTNIGEYAFSGCSNLTSITIPTSITEISEYAFISCHGLTSIIVETDNPVYDSRENCNAIIETASNKLIAGCQNTVIPNTITSIGSLAFYGCANLTSIIIPDSVTSIGERAFGSCDGLTSIVIPDSVTTLEDGILAGCENLASINGERELIVDGRIIAVAPAGLTSYTIPNGVTCIGDYVFLWCSHLTSITIPNSVTSLGKAAFSWCRGISSFIIPDSVTSIGADAFLNCTGLTSIVIPDSVTSIGVSAFMNCSSLKSIIIPDSVTSIGPIVFQSCSRLESITVYAINPPLLSGSLELPINTEGCPIYVPAESVEAYKSAQYWSNYADRIQAIPTPNNIIYYTSTDGNIVTPHATNVFGANIVSNEYVAGQGVLSFDGDVTSIGNYAFYQCPTLASIIIPESVTTVGVAPFGGCSSLEIISGPFVSPDGLFLIYSGSLWAVAGGAINGSIVIPESVTTISNYVFQNCLGLTEIVLPAEITSIRHYAFDGCSNLTKINIPEGVTAIPEGTFWDCSSLYTIELPEGITYIGEDAFHGCISLSSITLPKSLTGIDDSAFESCSGLTSIIVLSETPPSGGNGMFDNTNNAPIYVPSGSVDAYKTANKWKNYANRIYPISESSIPTNFNPNTYLLYRANKTGGFIGDDYRVKVSMMPGISGAKVEMKLQLTGPGPISTGNTMRDEYDYFEIRENALVWNDIYREDGEWWDDVLSFTIPSATSLLLIQFDGVNETMTINDNTSPCHRNSMTWSRLFVDYGHESDEGIWDVYSGVPDGSKLYYVRVWDADDTLNYIGYATTSVNPDTNRTEFCWCSYYPKTGTTSYDFANDAINQGGYQGYIAY